MIHPEEFIGLELEVKDSSNRSLVGLKGTVVDETKKTFTIASGKTIIKQGSVFLIAGKEVVGDDIVQRPEDRIKARR